jgi:hypothetical protein
MNREHVEWVHRAVDLPAEAGRYTIRAGREQPWLEME